MNLAKVKDLIVKNSPTVLTVAGCVGTIASVALSIDSTIRAKKMLEEKENATKKEKAIIYAKAYAPTAIMTSATLVCIVGSNHVNKQRIAGLASAYILRETALKEYKEKVGETFGKKKAEQIKNSILQDHINSNPKTEYNTFNAATEAGEAVNLWFDDLTGRYFYSNAERIRKAELEATKLLQMNGFVSINDVYELLGLPPVKIGYDNGWSTDWNQEVKLDIEGGLTDIDTPCGVLVMDPRPSNAWLSEL